MQSNVLQVAGNGTIRFLKYWLIAMRSVQMRYLQTSIEPAWEVPLACLRESQALRTFGNHDGDQSCTTRIIDAMWSASASMELLKLQSISFKNRR